MHNTFAFFCSSLDYLNGPSPWGFQSIQLGQSLSRTTPNAWVIFPDGKKNSDFTARPINLTSSMGSRLKQSFAKINHATPIESISGESLLKEVDEHSSEGAEVAEKDRNKKAIIAGAMAGGGALLFATVLIGGTLLTISGNGKFS